MAFDGFTTAHITAELKNNLTGGCISRIIQPEKDELYLTIKNNKTAHQLYMSASASLPLVYLTENKPQAPLSAPNFCMLLRKHLQGGKIIDISQPSLERVIIFKIEHRNELGDLCIKKLIIELMGKHSNIILTNDEDVIMDSIKRIPSSMSSVREVLPGRPYFIPKTTDKYDPFIVDQTVITENILSKPVKIVEALYKNLTGFSPLAAEEFAYEAGLEGNASTASLSQEEKNKLAAVVLHHIDDVRHENFTSGIVYLNNIPRDFASFPLLMYGDAVLEECENASVQLQTFYSKKNKENRLKEKTAALRHNVTNALDRVTKKEALQKKQLSDTEKKDKYRIWGELLNAYGYNVEEGSASVKVLNYYDNTEMTIPLDKDMNAQENAQKYFARYNKLKRTEASLSEQLKNTIADREQLENVLEALSIAETPADIAGVQKELEDSGWIKKHKIARGKVREEKSNPMLFRSTDGFTIAVGKNNYQNDELTFKYANGGDWWFHAKGRPGSHVILKTEGREVPDRAFEEAASLAAYYSRDGKDSPKVEIDYTLRREVKKTPGGKPGFVIYHQNYSMMAIPDNGSIERIE